MKCVSAPSPTLSTLNISGIGTRLYMSGVDLDYQRGTEQTPEEVGEVGEVCFSPGSDMYIR